MGLTCQGGAEWEAIIEAGAIQIIGIGTNKETSESSQGPDQDRGARGVKVRDLTGINLDAVIILSIIIRASENQGELIDQAYKQ
mmetsp:Transcript_35/g.33  ORF Transcript_35/g.33 Transcript_35/m.33 type:complete len:84 (-) Transcript_35:201-452(-)